MTLDARGLVEQLEAARERFLSFLRARLPDDEAAEEILQDSLVKSLEAAPGLRSQESLVPWFYAVLRNAVIDYYRRRARDFRRLEREFPEDIPSEDGTLGGALCECFIPLIESLKPEYAELIHALDLREEQPAEVAKRLGITPGNLKVRRHRARQALRRHLEQTCRVCAEHHCLDCSCRDGVVSP